MVKGLGGEKLHTEWQPGNRERKGLEIYIPFQ
jgi:hypothetical protein